MMNRIRKLLSLQAKCTVLQVVCSAFSRNRRIIWTSRKVFAFHRNINLLQLRCQHAINFIVVLTDESGRIDLQLKIS